MAVTIATEPGGKELLSSKTRNLAEQNVAEVIEPALAAGRMMLCDRFTHSSLRTERNSGGEPWGERGGGAGRSGVSLNWPLPRLNEQVRLFECISAHGRAALVYNLEATLLSGWIYDHLQAHASALKVAHPAMLRAIAASKKKNDRIDAHKIADLLRCDLLPECYMAPSEIRERRRTLR